MAKLGEQKYADCLLLVGDLQQEIYASRAILARNCVVFDTMFSSGMAESEPYDKKTGKLNPISMPDEDYDVFYLFLQLLYGDVQEIKADTTPDTFGKLADLVDKYQIENGSLVDACSDLLVAKARDVRFYEYLLAYRGQHGTRDTPPAVFAAMFLAARMNEFRTAGGLFAAKCSVNDLLTVTRGFCARDEAYRLQPEVAVFVRDCLVPAVARLANLPGNYSMGNIDRASEQPMFIEHKTYTFCLEQKDADAMALGNAYFSLSKSDVVLVWAQKAAIQSDMLQMQVIFGCPVYVAPKTKCRCTDPPSKPDAGLNPTCCCVDRSTKLPVSTLAIPLMTRAELDQLRAGSAGLPGQELVTFRVKLSMYYVQTLVQFYMLQNLSSISFRGSPPSFLDLLSSVLYSDAWDEKLSAPVLVDKLLDFVENSDGNDRITARDCMGVLFKHVVPWTRVSPQSLFKCMCLDEKYTDMSASDWAKIQKKILDDQALWTTRETRAWMTRGQQLNSSSVMATALIDTLRGTKRKFESDADSGSSSNKKARTA